LQVDPSLVLSVAHQFIDIREIPGGFEARSLS